MKGKSKSIHEPGVKVGMEYHQHECPVCGRIFDHADKSTIPCPGGREWHCNRCVACSPWILVDDKRLIRRKER